MKPAEYTNPDYIWPVVTAWGQGRSPSSAQMQQLKAAALEPQLNAWQLNAHTVEQHLTERAALLQAIAQRLEQGERTLPLPGPWTDWTPLMWTLWLPLAMAIDQAQRTQNAPFLQGVLGLQGTGKSTLTQILQLALSCLNQQAVVLSIDDLYLSYAQRRVLRKQDPRLIWRGPPGTHDVTLGIKTLAALKQGSPSRAVQLPRFDKSLHQGQGDRIAPDVVPAATVVLFEGWFVGARPLPEAIFEDPTFQFPSPIDTAEDRAFAKDCNRRLQAYLPLWADLDQLIVLRPENYHWSLEWRLAAEQTMMAQGKAGLSADEIAAFVTYFWQALHPDLFVTPLTLSPATNLVVNICHDHKLGSLCLPRGENCDRV